ncbi:hypothetical protein EDB84DRAFT_1495717, partial [Lactarius hengduanensis]
MQERDHHHEQRSRQGRCKLQALRCSFPGLHTPASSPLNTRAGTPDLLLTLTYSHTISGPSFHPCVRLNRFAQSSALLRPAGRPFHAHGTP